MKTELKIDGLKDLDALLGELPKATAKNTLKRAGLKAAEPMVQRMKALAPKRSGKLAAGIKATAVATGGLAGKAAFAAVKQAGGSSAQAGAAARSANRSAAGEPLSVVISIGPTGAGASRAHLEEFGTVHSKAHPFIRPGVDETKDQVIGSIRQDLGAEIDKATARLAKKRAKLAGG